MRILVLGGSRFIGLHLVQELLRRGHEVTVFNRGQTPGDLPPAVERLYGDRDVPDSVRAALSGRDFDVAYDISCYTLAQLAPAVETLDGHVGRYVYCSSNVVYTPASTLPVGENQPFVTDSPIQFHQYSIGKAACERYLLEQWRRTRFPFTSLRPVLVYGPDNTQDTWELAQFARLRQGRTIFIPGDGSQVLQFTHVDDVARAFADAVETGITLGQGYNIAGAEGITLNGFIELVGRAAGIAPRVAFVPDADDAGMPSSFPWIWRRPAYFAIDKARRDFGYAPRPLLGGLEETYRWYVEQKLDDYPWDFSAEDALRERATVTPQLARVVG